MTDAVAVRGSKAADIPAMLELIFTHGVNQWNFLPEAEVRMHLDGIASGKTQAVIAEFDGGLVGFVTFLAQHSLPGVEAVKPGSLHAYVCEAVVHREHAGKGIGSQLLRAATAALMAQGFNDIYIERHEENLASAGMMRKAGFIEIDCFDDPERRASGSRRTTVCRFVADGRQ